MRLTGRDPGSQRLDRLRAFQRLNLALLIDAQHQGFRRRVQVEADDVPQLAHEVGIAAELERLDAMGLEIVALARSDAPSPDSPAAASPTCARSSASRPRASSAASHSR